VADSGIHGYRCVCGADDDGRPDPVSALRAFIAHLEACAHPDAPEDLEDARGALAELTGEEAGDAEG